MTFNNIFLKGWQLENDWIKEQGIASKAAFGESRYSKRSRKRKNSDEEGGEQNADEKDDDDPDKYVIKGKYKNLHKKFIYSNSQL